METFQHTFPATPVRQAYTALAARVGLNAYPVVSYEGRNCVVVGEQRIFNKRGGCYFNSLSVRFIDGAIEQIPAGRFNTKAKAPV